MARCGLGVLLLSTIGLLVLYHTDTADYITRLAQRPSSWFSGKVTPINSCSTARLNGSLLPVDLSYFSHCHQTPIRSSTREMKTSIDKNKKIILFYNNPVWYLSEKSSITRSKCKVAACEMTSNRSRLREAVAVVFHTCQLYDRQPPARTSPRQIWVAFGLESTYSYGGHYKAPEWRGVFNWTMGYRLDSDIFTPYSFMKLRPPPAGKNYTAIALAKKRPVAWFVSHCRVQSRRESYVKRLQQYIDVDIYGKCGTLSCPKDNSERACYTNYYFYLSFESTICKDYVTEKFFKLFTDIDTIPVARGGFDYNKFFDQRTFVNTADFGSPKQLANHLMRLMNDVEAYTSMLKAKDLYHVDDVRSLDTAFCDLCERLQRPDIQHRVYPDHWEWVTRNTCRAPTDLTAS